MTNTLEYNNGKNKFIFIDKLDTSLITHDNFNLLHYVNNYSLYNEKLLENFIEFCVNKCTGGNSMFYFLGKGSEIADKIGEYTIVNNYLKHDENEKYLIPLICESKGYRYEGAIFNFFNDSLSNNIKYNYIITNEKRIEKKLFETIKEHLDRRIYLNSIGL